MIMWLDCTKILKIVFLIYWCRVFTSIKYEISLKLFRSLYFVTKNGPISDPCGKPDTICQILKKIAIKTFFYCVMRMLISELLLNRMYSCVVQAFTMISVLRLHWSNENSLLNILLVCGYLHKICNFFKIIQISLFCSQKWS